MRTSFSTGCDCDPASWGHAGAVPRASLPRFLCWNAVMADLDVPYLDLSEYEEGEKEALTLAAMERGEPLIYSGRISAGGLLLGIPDLLRKEAGGYVAGDIKSGAGEESGGDEEGGKPKKSLCRPARTLYRRARTPRQISRPARVRLDNVAEQPMSRDASIGPTSLPPE
jgi:hypothetical protein